MNKQQFNTPEAPFKIFLPSKWEPFTSESGKRKGIHMPPPWLWTFVIDPSISFINIDSRNSYRGVSWQTLRI